MTVYPDYFYAERDFDTSHMGYKPLTIPAGVEAQPLAVPPLLAPDKVDANDIYYTIEVQEGESQILPGKKTETWGLQRSPFGPDPGSQDRAKSPRAFEEQPACPHFIPLARHGSSGTNY